MLRDRLIGHRPRKDTLKRYYVRLTIDGETTIYEVSRDEQRFLLDHFPEPTIFHMPDDVNQTHTIMAEKRTNYQNASQKGKGNLMPRELRNLLFEIFHFPLEELKELVWKHDGRIITLINEEDQASKAKELYENGATPYRAQPGDHLTRFDGTPAGVVASPFPWVKS